MKIRKPRTSRALLDVILGVLAVLLLFVSASSEGDMQPKADYIIEVTWNEAVNVDIDTWVMLPSGTKMSYRNKDTGYASIDRDDLGYGKSSNDPAPANIELTSIRAPLDGVYYMSIHNYNTKVKPFNPDWQVWVTMKQISKQGVPAKIIYTEVLPMPTMEMRESPVFMFRILAGKVVEVRPSERRIVG